MDISQFYLCLLVLVFAGNINAFKKPKEKLKSIEKGSDNDDWWKKSEEETDDGGDDDYWSKTDTDKNSRKNAEGKGFDTGIGDSGSDFDWDGDSDGDLDSTTTAKYGLNKGWDSNSDNFGYPKYLNKAQSVNSFPEIPSEKEINRINSLVKESDISSVDTDNSIPISNSDYEDSSLSGGHVAGITLTIVFVISIGCTCLRICLCPKRSSGATSGRTISPGTGCRVLSVTSLAAVPTGPDSDRVGLIAVRQTRIFRA